MTDLLPFIRKHPDGSVLEVYVQPKASKNEFAGMHQESLKVRLTAPPVEGEANKGCVKFLSKVLGIPKSDVTIIQGQKSRQKSILIRGFSPHRLQEILMQNGVTEGSSPR